MTSLLRHIYVLFMDRAPAALVFRLLNIVKLVLERPWFLPAFNGFIVVRRLTWDE